MNQLALLSGIDIPIQEISATLHQPTLKDISYIGEEEYFTSLQLICFNKNLLIMSDPKGNLILQNMNNFQIFMTLMGDPNEIKAQQKRNSIIKIFKLFFPDYDAQILPRSVYFNNKVDKSSFSLTEENFDIVQSTIFAVSGLNSSGSGSNSQYNPAGPKAAAIAAKLMKARAKIQGNKKGFQSVLARYTSVLTVGLNSMSLNECMSLTVAQLYDLIERYGLYTAWDIDIRSRLAGGKPDKQPDDWMKPLH